MISAALQAFEESQNIQQLRQNFLSLYPRRDVFIWREMQEGSGWRKATGPLVDYQILGVISDSGRGLYRGCYWSHRTCFAVLDVDQESKYHSRTELERLTANLADIGLTATLYQSSDSNGWHVYLFFDDWEDSEEVKQSLKRWLRALGYEIKSGVLEIFPSGNALRLPLQKGFAWLAQDGSLIKRREELREHEALASFLCDLHNNQSKWSEAKSRINSRLEQSAAAASDGAIAHLKALSLEGLEDLYGRGKIQEKWENGRQWWHHGLSASGQRHDAVLSVGHYLWYGDAENGVPAYPGTRHNQTRARLIETWLSEKHNGYCRHLEAGNWQTVKEQIERAVNWRRDEPQVTERPHYPLTDRLLKRLTELYKKTGKLWDIDKLAQANIDRSDEARHRIAVAVRQCVDNGWQITRNSLAKVAGSSPNTVSKHKDLWFLLSAGSGVLITWGGSPISLEEEEKKISNPEGVEIKTNQTQNLSSFGLESEFQLESVEIESADVLIPPSSSAFGELCLTPSAFALAGDGERLTARHLQELSPPPPLFQLESVEIESADVLIPPSSSAFGELCLTPSAFALAGDGERLTTRHLQELSPPPPFFSLALGSNTGLEGLRYACGISSLAGLVALAPVFLGEIFLSGLWTSQHRQGEQQRRPGSAGTVRRSERRKCSKAKPRNSQRAPPLLL